MRSPSTLEEAQKPASLTTMGYGFASPAVRGVQYQRRHTAQCGRNRLWRAARRPRMCLSREPVPSVDSVRAMLTSGEKRSQQRALVLVRLLAVEDAMPLLEACVSSTACEFVRATAAVTFGHLVFARAESALRARCLRQLVELLHSDGDYGVRAGAAAGLGGYAAHHGDVDGTILDALKRAIYENSEWQVKFSALAALGELRDKRAIPVLLPALANSNDLLVQAAIGALGNIGDVSVVPRLLAMMGSGDMMTRQQLAQALGHMDKLRTEPAVLDALRTLARDQSTAVREAAKEALRRFGCGDSLMRTPSDADFLKREVDAMLKGDEAGDADINAEDALRRRLERSFDKECVDGASEDGGGGGGGGGIANKAAAAVDSETAADSVSDLQPQLSEAEYEAAVADLSTDDTSKQTLALIALRRADAQAVRTVVLEAGLLNPQRAAIRVRSLAVRLVARAHDMETVLRTLRDDPEENVRSACCDAAAEAGGGEQAVSACVRSFEEDPHWLVRISAAIALGTIGKGQTRVEDALINALSTGGVRGDLPPPQESVVRRHAIIALGFLGSTRCLPALRALVDDGNTEQPVRLRIANALRGIHSREAVQLLQRLVKDEHPEVAEMAQVSLDTLTQLGYA